MKKKYTSNYIFYREPKLWDPSCVGIVPES